MPRSYTIGIPWYERETYASLVAALDDGRAFPASYDIWLVGARKLLTGFERMNERTVRVVLYPEEFTAWCCEQGLRRDPTARLHYATWFVTGRSRWSPTELRTHRLVSDAQIQGPWIWAVSAGIGIDDRDSPSPLAKLAL